MQRKVSQINTEKGMTVNELVKEMSGSGVMGAGSLARSVDILESMIKDKECRVFFGQAGAMVPGGMRNILIDMIESGWIHVFVTTGATLTHDIVESLGIGHYQGSPHEDDEKLHKKGLDRMYDSYMPDSAYPKMEDFLNQAIAGMETGKTSIKDFLQDIGEKIKGPSILASCARKKIPVFCPALADSGLGIQAWGMVRKKKIEVSAFDDLNDIIDISWTAKKKGVFYVGGGVPKNFIQQAMQFSRQADYAVQITTDRPEPGGSSGAPLREGISWGKLGAKSMHADLFCDATIALPIIHAALKERL
ncbi:deoxyhypusine synthase family protein [Candidatus Woesearchaeota archaeon]|nr:deoxyhypusine synthase family protein [Candidatus Woesearchaeota archaeon]